MAGQLSAEQAKQWIDDNEKDALVIDLRSPEEYRRGHIAGSINVPMDEIDEIRRLTPNRHATLLLYCQCGRNSRCARSVLMYMGYKDVWNIGGIRDWPYEIVKETSAY